MAIYHCSVKPICRSAGQSSCASSAYRSAEKIKDERTEIIHDYTRKKAVDFTALIGWNSDRSSLWNTAEKAEKRKDATVSREYELALPKELSNDEKISLVLDYSTWIYERHNVAVDVCVHQIDSDNPHAHIMTTTRSTDGDLLGDKVPREWSDTKRKQHGLLGRKNDLIEAREVWATHCNKALEDNNFNERVSHLSLSDQGIQRVPQIHIGYVAKEMEKAGLRSIRGERNREIIRNNQPPIVRDRKNLSKAIHLDRLLKRNSHDQLCGNPQIDDKGESNNQGNRKQNRWKENILRNINRHRDGSSVRKLSDIARSLPRMPQRDLYDRERQRQPNNPSMLLQPTKRNNVGFNEQETDRVLRRRESSEQLGTFDIKYKYNKSEQTLSMTINGKKPLDVVTNTQLKAIQSSDKILLRVDFDDLQRGEIPLKMTFGEMPRFKTLNSELKEVEKVEITRGFTM
ncbi:MobA/MobL family protein [Photobacterium carnosum]|uniref:MobA/MobL family protein n=1 Tax=Photobacterium carnosum TaxID=2023717 RepID=UPI001C8FDB5F|nr:MobA/MobL family protein [Photobacterium carnosum]MBY3790671.1 MobA/MobL family protein [Photobacterium carnosum]MCD9535777.1 hypothetical protein [Photobacterium carnosum]